MQGLACITDIVPYREKLMYSSLLIPGFFFVLLVPALFAQAAFSKSNRSRIEKCWDAFYFSILFITFAAYPAVSRNILSTFACVNLGIDGNYIRADMRMACPGGGDFATIWAAVFTGVIPAGVPAILLILMMVKGVPCLAGKKHRLALLEGVVHTFAKEVDKLEVDELFKVLITVPISHRDEALVPQQWLAKAGATNDGQRDVNDQTRRQTLSKVLMYTYPFGKDKMTHAEVLSAVDAQRKTLQFVPSSNFETPDDDAVLFTLFAWSIRQLGMYSRGAADRSTSLFSLLHKASKLSNPQRKVSVADQQDNKEWEKVFDENIISFKPQKGAGAGSYPGATSKLQMSRSQSRALRNELAQQLHIAAERMHSAKLLSVREPSWDASESATAFERKTLQRLGFLFQSYRPSVWYFEIIEIVRKLIMASILIFVYAGTSAQVAVGFIVTLVALLLSLWLHPFNDDSLQGATLCLSVSCLCAWNSHVQDWEFVF